jgi:enediyne biosynthesis protein E4
VVRHALALSLVVLLPACPVAPTVYAESTLAADEIDEGPSEAELDDAPASETSALADSLAEASATADGPGEADDGAPPSDLPGDPPIEQIVFTEVAAAAGLDYVHSEFQSAGNCLVDTVMPPLQGWFCSIDWSSGGAAAADFDEDGWVDLFVTRPYAPDLLFRNQADGSFVDVAAEVGLADQTHHAGAAWADIDNDGDLDLYVTNVLRKRYALYINDGGRFEEQAEPRGADTASDARHHGFSPAFGDYDADGFLDLHLTEWVQIPLDAPVPSHARLLRNRGREAPGYFQDTTELAGVDVLGGPRATRTSYSSRFADLDADGALDLLVVADFGASRLFWNEGDGFLDGTLFSGVGGDQNGMGSALGDYDGDGDLDWFITAIFDPDYRCDNVTCGWGITGNRLYRNDGARRFSDTTDLAGVRDGGWGWGAEFFDYDNDGALDLVMSNGVDFPNPEAALFRRDPTRLWHNLGGGRFEEVAARVGVDDRGDGKGLLVFDYDRDGDQDLLIAQHEGRALLYRNDGGEQNAWLAVKLKGRASNRHGLGAQLSVTRAPGERALLREVSGGNAFLGQSEAVAHFGLGAWTGMLHELRVHWPSGRTQVLRAVVPRQLLEVREPD